MGGIADTPKHVMDFRIVFRPRQPEPDAVRCRTEPALLPLDARALAVSSFGASVYVDGSSIEPADDFLRGLPRPAGADDFAIRDLRRDGDEFRFTVLNCLATGYSDWLPFEVAGRPGAWKTVKPASRPALFDKALLGLVAVPGGGVLYEEALGAGKARDGYRFVVEGASSGIDAPTPASGSSGCKFAMLGHGYLRFNRDGSLIGLGSLCFSGNEPLTILPSPPDRAYVTLDPGNGPLAVEHWSEGASRVMPLPGAPRSSNWRSADIIEPRAGELWISMDVVAGETASRPYVARFDGVAWRESTPAHAPAHLVPLVMEDGELLLLSPETSYRWTGTQFAPIVMPAWQPCSYNEKLPPTIHPASGGKPASVAPSGTAWFTFDRCVLSIDKGASRATAHFLPEGRSPYALQLVGEFPVVWAGGDDGEVLALQDGTAEK
ncbi:hypothetical protein [Polyangium aurulentum]|uniref:hypothetical protein n=1 Tax=Polyangium aurulentum TaxID=2567896 RepID=UPI0010AE88FB|nr:hypothetical protein [Polyangium aurulentum]UQA61421.1 hypothetical protein E8A73_013475 [Polyangium aurulentum]